MLSKACFLNPYFKFAFISGDLISCIAGIIYLNGKFISYG